jgi:hypothetical protein
MEAFTLNIHSLMLIFTLCTCFWTISLPFFVLFHAILIVLNYYFL